MHVCDTVTQSIVCACLFLLIREHIVYKLNSKMETFNHEIS